MLAASRSRDSAGITIGLLDDWFGGALNNVSMRLWDGRSWPDDRPRPATLLLKHPGSMRAMFLQGSELGIAEAYINDDFDVDGDMESAFELYDALCCASRSISGRLSAMARLRRLPACKPGRGKAPLKASLTGAAHSGGRDVQAVSHHYDLSNEFYSLWLDKRMVYSCAYFDGGAESLDDAQVRKLDYVCRKLRLRPNQRILDIGCGWGGLIMHAAANYGVDATGITLSRAQADLASARIEDHGLSTRCRVKVMDYRDVDEGEPYDALVSIGMFEHVGVKMLPAYFGKAYRLLREGGVFLNHGIARRATDPVSKELGFIDVYVFPDGELVPINETVHAAENAGFEVRDVESLREHYTLTLRSWVNRLEVSRDDACRCVGESAYRVWRLYMSGSAYWFRTGRNNVYQTLLSKTRPCGSACLPLTRADWY